MVGVCVRKVVGMFVRLEKVFPLESNVPPPKLCIAVVFVSWQASDRYTHSIHEHGRNPCLHRNKKRALPLPYLTSPYLTLPYLTTAAV